MLAVLYALFVLLVVVATGNHFFIDAIAGALVAGLAGGSAALFTSPVAATQLTPLMGREPALEKLAA